MSPGCCCAGISCSRFLGLDKDSGLNWALSIVFLVITARLLLFRLFIKQVKYQRHMQLMQPKIQQLREKYKNDRAAMQREMMKLQQEEGFNPLAGCLPMLLQIPIFISLFHVLRHLSNSVASAHGAANPKLTLYTFTSDETLSAAKAKLFGAPLAASLRDNADKITQLGGDLTSTRTVTLVLVLVSAAATFFTQLLVRRGQPTTPVGTAATVQKLMLYFIPISVLFSGLFFPLGVLLYWFTSNVWTMASSSTSTSSTRTCPRRPARSASSARRLPRSRARGRCGIGRTINVTPAEVVDDDVTPRRLAAAAAHAAPAARRTAERGSSRPSGKRPSQAKKRR